VAGAGVGRDRVTRAWTVLLLGGPAGAGKTTVAQALGRHYAVSVTQTDDIQAALEAVTLPQHLPPIHFWRTHPNPGALTAEQIQRQGLEVMRVMRTALGAAIANHLEEAVPVVYEGDFVDPALARERRVRDVRADGRIRGVFLLEEDVETLSANFAAREPDAGPQRLRAEVSALWSRWLAKRCRDHDVPTVAARPRDTLLARVLAAIG
jgi:2-phosphoglycerate kinase